jgi:hypothetical protein
LPNQKEKSLKLNESQKMLYKSLLDLGIDIDAIRQQQQDDTSLNNLYQKVVHGKNEQ